MTDIAVDQQQEPASSISRPVTATAALAALGIVYGDLGTSPLYTLTAIIERLDIVEPPHGVHRARHRPCQYAHRPSAASSLPRSGWGSCR